MPDVLVLLGSKSDKEIGEKATKLLGEFGISCQMLVASAHRSPKPLVRLIETSDAKIFIGIAGVSAALPGVIAAHTTRPVIGVPVSGKVNLDSILAVSQMPPGVPVAAVGLDRGENAALLAVQILALSRPELGTKLKEHKEKMERQVLEDSQSLGA